MELQRFVKNKTDNLVIYLTAGYPNFESMPALLLELEKTTVDIIEIGIPFSDSLVDGPTIQECNMQALKNGMTLEKIFEQLNSIKDQLTKPLILMGSYNQILQYGLSAFLEKTQEANICGVILPDLPPEIYQAEHQNDFEAAGLNIVFLITKKTPDERIKYLDSLSKAFLYLVSMDGVTGQGLTADQDLEIFCSHLKSLQLDNPFLIGFGISSQADFSYVSSISNGSIIGSAFLRSIAKNQAIEFVSQIKPKSLS